MKRKKPQTKREELQTKRKLFTEVAYPKKQKPRTVSLLPRVNISVPTAFGRVEEREILPALRWEDLLDKIVKDLDHMQRLVVSKAEF